MKIIRQQVNRPLKNAAGYVLMTFFYTNVQSVYYRVIFFSLMLMGFPASVFGLNRPYILDAAQASDSIPMLHSAKGNNLSQDGHVKLEWELDARPSDGVFEVQQATHKAFTNASTIYRGPDLATFVSGLENGTYYYRVRLGEQAWSEPLQVEVKHHSASLTFLLLGIGALVFLLTVTVVLKGPRRSSLKT